MKLNAKRIAKHIVGSGIEYFNYTDLIETAIAQQGLLNKYLKLSSKKQDDFLFRVLRNFTKKERERFHFNEICDSELFGRHKRRRKLLKEYNQL